MTTNSNQKIESAKTAVLNMIMYYKSALSESGCSDPNQQIATTLANAVGLEDPQKEYIFKKVADEKYIKIFDTLNNILLFLDGAIGSENINVEDIKLIRTNISVILNIFEKERQQDGNFC